MKIKTTMRYISPHNSQNGHDQKNQNKTYKQ